MATTIQDGTGKGFQAKVDDTNRITTRSITEDAQLEATVDGNTFFVGNPYVTQTGSSINGLLYFNSDEEVDLFAKTFSCQARYASGASFDNFTILVYSNVEESSLTGTWTDFTPLNLNFGSSNTLAGSYKYGSATGASFSNIGTTSPKIQLAFPVNVYNQISTNLIIPKGIGILVAVVPPTGNTSMPVQFGLALSKLNNI